MLASNCPYRSSFVATPEAEVKDDAASQRRCLESEPQQAALQDVSSPVAFRLTEERDHPLVRRQTQGSMLGRQAMGQLRLAGTREPDDEKQDRHAVMLSEPRSRDTPAPPLISTIMRPEPTRPGTMRDEQSAADVLS